MVNIYKITDCNRLCYIGSTKQTVEQRLTDHRYHKNNKCKTKRPCSSCQLDLENCQIEVLETCDNEIRYEREGYWIQNTECVNIVKMYRDYKKRRDEWYQENKDIKKVMRDYQKSFGGDKRFYNNLLEIDVNLFTPQ